MKKIMILIVALSVVAMASVKMAGAKVLASSMVLVVLGGLALPGLVVGDLQWQHLTNNNKCDSEHIIYTLAPQIKDGIVGRVQLSTPCNEWYEYNGNIGDKK